MGRFEIFGDKAGGFRVRLKAANGRKLWVSESYTRHFDALRAAKACRTAADGANLYDLVTHGMH